VNGLIGSHIADQLLKNGYHVRGAVRSIQKNDWLQAHFDGKHEGAEFSLVEVPDMAADGCYDNVLQGKKPYTTLVAAPDCEQTDVHGFIHVASPMDGSAGSSVAISTGVSGGLNALKACAKTSSVQRFVFTSSSIAATFAKPNVDYSVTEESFNEDALRLVRDDPQADGLRIYAAVKTATEKAMWEWVKENNPHFTVNAIVSPVSCHQPDRITLTPPSSPMPTSVAS
jgi:nucleoside-diphosphate-sugar epimerase